jgi:mannose-1-phosphate guanylyltransferase
LPSDQWIPDVPKFWSTVARARALVEQDDVLVTFGIPVRAPHTGYGYIERGQALAPGAYRSLRFHEKPDLDRARAYLESGRFYWNAGILLFRARTILRELARHAPETSAPLQALERRTSPRLRRSRSTTP